MIIMWCIILAMNLAYSWDYALSGSAWDGTCKSGTLQSPIDLSNDLMQRITNSSYFSVGLNYSTVEVTPGFTEHSYLILGSLGTMSFQKSTPELTTQEQRGSILGLHFHAPSEHYINGKAYDLEMHIVMTDIGLKYNNIVLATIFRIGNEENAFIKQVIEANNVKQNFSLADNFRINTVKNFYLLIGSLTVPPCTENVLWIVNTDIQTISQAQYSFFANKWAGNSTFAGGNGNNRDLQLPNGRVVYLYGVGSYLFFTVSMAFLLI